MNSAIDWLSSLQMTKAIRKILYAADAQDSPLAEAQELLDNPVEDDAEAEETQWTYTSPNDWTPKVSIFISVL